MDVEVSCAYQCIELNGHIDIRCVDIASASNSVFLDMPHSESTPWSME